MQRLAEDLVHKEASTYSIRAKMLSITDFPFQ